MEQVVPTFEHFWITIIIDIVFIGIGWLTLRQQIREYREQSQYRQQDFMMRVTNDLTALEQRIKYNEDTLKETRGELLKKVEQLDLKIDNLRQLLVDIFVIDKNIQKQ